MALKRKLHIVGEELLDGINPHYRDLFYVSKKVGGNNNHFAVISPQKFEKFLSRFIRDKEIPERVKLLILTMACGGLRISEALGLKKDSFFIVENEGVNKIVVKTKVLKKRQKISYETLLDYYINDSGKVNQEEERKESRRKSLTKTLKKWIKLCNKGIKISNLAPDLVNDLQEVVGESKKLFQSMTMLKAGSKTMKMNSKIGPEFSYRFDLFIDEFSKRYGSMASLDITRLRDALIEAKKKRLFLYEERTFSLAMDKEGLVEDLVLNILDNTWGRGNNYDPVFTSDSERKKRVDYNYKSTGRIGLLKPLSIRGAEKAIKKALGDTFTTHALRHSFISYLLKRGKNKAEVARFINISEDVVIKYANLVDVNNPDTFDGIFI